jgi:hypothetical protein
MGRGAGTMTLGCVYCDPTDTHWRPTKFYILDGRSVCEYHLRKIQTQNEDPEPENTQGQPRLEEVLEPYAREAVDIVARHLVGLTMKLYNEDGVCLMSSRVGAPVVNGDTVQFPPIKISL